MRIDRGIFAQTIVKSAKISYKWTDRCEINVTE